MTIAELIAQMRNKQPPAPDDQIRAFEAKLGCRLPADYRDFLKNCNGGFLGGELWFLGPTPMGEKADAGIHHVGGFRNEGYLSLSWHLDCYRKRIPAALLWIMDDPFGNAICIGIEGH